MGYHHLALATRDMAAIHAFYEGVMGFELVKVEVAKVQQGGWAKHFFYRMDGDDSSFVAFWELHDVPGAEGAFETNLSKAAGLPDPLNHIAFGVSSAQELDRRRTQWTDAGQDVMEIDHNWCRSIYTRDPNDNVVEFCLTTGSFDAADRARALVALGEHEANYSPPPASMAFHQRTDQA
jgi:catechol 2,3-dioxygenase-like lactoylglutathione lyase family enzyme